MDLQSTLAQAPSRKTDMTTTRQEKYDEVGVEETWTRESCQMKG